MTTLGGWCQPAPGCTHTERQHRDVRAAYMGFLATQAVVQTLPEAIGTLPARHLPLELHESTARNSILRTRFEDAQIAVALEIDEPVRAYGIPKKPVSVNRIEKVGPIALLHLSRRLTHPLIDAHAAIYCDVKRPLHVARVRAVQVRLDREAA